MRRGQEGVSLVEALLSVLVVSAGLVGIARFQIQAWRSGLDAVRLTEAAHLAAQRLDALAVEASLGAAPADGADAPGPSITRYDRRWTVRDGDGTLRLEVQAGWPDDAGPLMLRGAAQPRRRPDDGAWLGLPD